MNSGYPRLFFCPALLLPLEEVQFQNAIAGIADVVVLCPAGGAGPPPAQGALLQPGGRIRAVAEVAVEPGERGCIFLRGLTLLSHHGDVIPDAGEQVRILPGSLCLTSSRSFFPEHPAAPRAFSGCFPSSQKNPSARQPSPRLPGGPGPWTA